MDKRNRQAQLPIEPIYCAAPQETCEILCSGSDDELDEPARLAKRLRYEEQGLRYLEGRPPRLISASLRGPFDKGWQNPWLPKRPNTKSSVSRPTFPRPAVKSIASKAPARLSGSKNATPMTGDSMQCHLPSPKSNGEVQLDEHAGLDFEKRFLIHDWANGVPSDTLERDEFWAPDQGRGASPHSKSKKRPAASDWLKSKLSKRKLLDHCAPSPTIHIPTPAAAMVQASTALDPDLPIASLEMTTPSSSTGLCSAKPGAKAFDPVTEEEDTDMSSDNASSSGDESGACVSQQDATGVVVDTHAPQSSPPGSSEDYRQTVPERSEADKAGIAFESHMDDSFHYWTRPIHRKVARSASPILIATETGAQPEHMEPPGPENDQRSGSCDIQKSTFIKDHPKQDYELAAMPERADDTTEASQEARPTDTTSYQRALSLPSQLFPERCIATAELDATKRAKSLGAEHQPEKQHRLVTFPDKDAVLVPVGDIAMLKDRVPIMNQTNLPSALVGALDAIPKSSHAGEADGAQDVQVERPSNKEPNANSTLMPGIECGVFESTLYTSLEKLMSEDDTTLIGDVTYSGDKPRQDAYTHAPDEASVSNSLSEHPEVDVMAEVVYSATQDETPARGAVSEPTVPSPGPKTVFIQDVAQEAPKNGTDVESCAVQRTISPMEPQVLDQTADSPARLPGHIEERPKTPTSTPSPCQGQDTIGISQQTPWAAIGLDATLELELSVKSFAKFNTPSPKPSYRSYRYPGLSGGHLPSTPLLFDVANTNPWSTGQSQSSRRSSRRSTRRVSFAPLPGEEKAANEQPSVRSIIRPKSPPPSLDTPEGAEDLGDQFSGHFNAVRRRHDQEPQSCLQRLLPTESQQQLSPAVNAMATAFRETDAYHTRVLEDCPTPASGLQETVENEEDGRTEAPQSPWRSDTLTLALDPVAAVLQNLDDFLNPRWDTEAPLKPARRSGDMGCLEDQENRSIQVGLDGANIWETA